MDSSKRQARLERRKAQQRQGQLRWLFYIVVGAVALTVLLILAQQLSGPRQVTYTQKEGVFLGDPNAPVTLIEFADFQCSHCLNSYNTTELPLIQQYVETGKIRYQYEMVGFLGPESVASAEAAYCAADQNYFWEYHDIVFAPTNYSSGNVGGYSEDNLIRFAEQVSGLDVNAFRACLASDEQLTAVDEAHNLASSFGVSGTPGFVINGTVLAGEQPLARLQQVIEEALAAVGGN